MKILVDENLPRHLKKMLATHEADTVKDMGWTGYKNGDLLALAESEYDVFLTADKNLRYQQNMQERRLALVIFPTNKLSVVKQLNGELENVLNDLKAGDFIELSMPGL